MDYDVFNGDADGICALHQLRLTEPRAAELVTGVKRDIGLLDRLTAGPGDRVTVLDVSMEKNAAGLARCLAAGAEVFYADHHGPGEIPAHPRLLALIDTSPEVCTSLLVDRHLQGRHRPWAVVAAFGDNLAAPATAHAAALGLDTAATDALRELGELLNYNAYGDAIDDLHFPPAELYQALHPYSDPFEFLRTEPAFGRLRAGFASDWARAEALAPVDARDGAALYVLPDAAWCRRVSGVLGNRLATASPARAHAVLSPKPGGGFLVSVRAPLARREGADTLCAGFESGGGRKAAAGINHLPEADVDRFAQAFFAAYP